jgi:D-alanyl-D-alanine carboxypeptidase
MKRKKLAGFPRIPALIIVAVFCFSCAGKDSAALASAAAITEAVSGETGANAQQAAAAVAAAAADSRLQPVLDAAGLPPDMRKRIEENAPAFLAELEKMLAEEDSYLRILVDKQHPLSSEYEPGDLIELRYKSYRAGIAAAMLLRQKAEEALEEMAAAAKAEGLTLTVSSAYRSYEYQIGSFDRWTKRLGLEQAERVSARPGRSQHQLGLVVDFGSISNDFAETAAGIWVKANAGRFGWSISYPREHEALTGYSWESWHYRYVGRGLVSFIDSWFAGVQQHALRFIHEWEA